MWKFPLWLWSSVWTAMDLWVPHISVETFLLQKRQWCKIPQESSGILRNFAQYVKLSTRLTPNVGPVRLLNHLQKQLNVMYVLVWVVRPLWCSVGLCARPVAWLQLLVEPVEKLQIHEYLCSFSPYRGVFSLCFCIPLADCIVLPNKYYYIHHPPLWLWWPSWLNGSGDPDGSVALVTQIHQIHKIQIYDKCRIRTVYNSLVPVVVGLWHEWKTINWVALF